MKKSVIRVLAMALVFMLAFGTGCSLADSGEWTCPDCGKVYPIVDGIYNFRLD